MKKIILLIILLFGLIESNYSQNRSNIWMLGYPIFVPDCGIDFNAGQADTFSVWKDLEFFATNACICDTLGQIALYTNAITINNRENEALFNSQGFNPGQQTTEDSLSGLSASGGAIIVPHPENINLYNIFHISGEEILNSSETQPLVFRYSEVDMTLDNGLGGVTDKKGVAILYDTLVWGRLSACKHGNGRDWWVITHRWNSDLYYKFLLTPDTLLGPFEQHIGSVVNKDDIAGQACFSPDGSKFAYMNRNFNFDYLQFDRCNGQFSDPVNILLPDSNLSQGISFSANNRFIYGITHNNLLQYDTWSTDLLASMIWVDSIPLQGNEDDFGIPMLAPDNKIYISTYHGVQAMHVINYPDSLGTACGFVKLGLTLPSYNVYSIPNHTNYDLGPVEGSSCDTLYLSPSTLPSSIQAFKISPNPVSASLNIVYNAEEDAFFQLTDIYGKRAAANSLFHYFKNRLVNVSGLPAGVYFATVTQKGKMIWSERVVITR